MRTRSAWSRRIIACASSRQDNVMCGKTHNCRVANATALFAKTRETLLQAQDRLGPVLGRRSTCLRSIEAGSWGSPRRALSLRSRQSPRTSRRPCSEPGAGRASRALLTSVGSKRVIAFYEPGGGHCSINVVVWDRADESGRFGGARSRQPEPSPDGSHRQRREQVDQPSVRRLMPRRLRSSIPASSLQLELPNKPAFNRDLRTCHYSGKSPSG